MTTCTRRIVQPAGAQTGLTANWPAPAEGGAAGVRLEGCRYGRIHTRAGNAPVDSKWLYCLRGAAMYWLISDTHFGHTKLVASGDRPPDLERRLEANLLRC